MLLPSSRQKVNQSGANVKPEEIKKVSEFDSYAQTRSVDIFLVCVDRSLAAEHPKSFTYVHTCACARMVASCLALPASTAAIACRDDGLPATTLVQVEYIVAEGIGLCSFVFSCLLAFVGAPFVLRLLRLLLLRCPIGLPFLPSCIS